MSIESTATRHAAGRPMRAAQPLWTRRTARRGASSGSILLVTAISAVALILFIGLVIDIGLAYGKRAELSKAADAAALAGLGSFSDGTAYAEQVARDVFEANYQERSLDARPHAVQVRFVSDANGNQTIEVTARAWLRTLFMRILPDFSEVEVATSAQATRSRLVLSLALDRSGSMRSNSGCVALAPAVDTFVTLFNDSHDSMSLSTYASNATLDVALTRPFQSAVMAAVPRQCTEYQGYTYLDGGLELAFQENQGATVHSSAEVIQVIVLFTDGLANTFQETLSCPAPTPLNLTSGDGGNDVRLLDPLTGSVVCGASNGGSLPCCPTLVTFPSVNGGTRFATGPFAGRDIRLEGKDRALARAVQARQAGNVIYTIGLGQNLDPVFLRQIANDPASPTFDPTQPVGAFAHAPTADELREVFVEIARKISLRISR